MILRRSEFTHVVPLGAASALLIHAVTQVRLTVTAQVARLIEFFDGAVELEVALPQLAIKLGHDQATIRACAMMLLERGVLSDRSVEDDRAKIVRELTGLHGRDDPTAALDRYRRAQAEGSHPYWGVQAARGIDEPSSLGRRLDLLLFGDCDVQMETDFLRREATRRCIDLRVVASFIDDLQLAEERRHDAIVIGALQARHAIVLGDARHHGGDPARVYVESVRSVLHKLRAITPAPILIDALPEPTVQPLGLADRGQHSHRNRFRRTNLALEQLAEDFADVHVVDVAAALGAEGAARLLDDGLVSFTHFGSPGWMLQRPESELAAVHHKFPDIAPLTDYLGGDPYRREAVMARVHMDTLTVVLGLGRKKCVIVDLDGVLWPGVLAETGSPFAWTAEISSPNSYIGLYFGIHEALRALRRRGILLACVSKNDEATVQELWRYPEHYPRPRLLTLESFVTSRINWRDKPANIRSIAEELGFALDAFVFVDDSPLERERVRRSLPEVAVLGDDLFALRRALLTDPRLQPARLTPESAVRSELVKAQLDRSRLRAEVSDESAFLGSLEIVCTVERLAPDTADAGVLARVQELFERTTQFNANGRKFAVAELQGLVGASDARVFTLRMRDRFADHGLVGAAVVAGGEILNFVMSCRVIGLGGECALLTGIIGDHGCNDGELRAQIVTTERNTPVRNLYRDNGFIDSGQGRWSMSAGADKAGHLAA
jgi:FkbH-like protein